MKTLVTVILVGAACALMVVGVGGVVRRRVVTRYSESLQGSGAVVAGIVLVMASMAALCLAWMVGRL